MPPVRKEALDENHKMNKVHESFEEQAKRVPESTAISFREERITYLDLNRRANQLARFLRKAGAGGDSLVAVCLERGPLLLTVLMAVLKAGAAYLPMDPRYPGERLNYMLRDSRARLLVTDDPERFRDLPDACGLVSREVMEAGFRPEPDDDLNEIIGADALCYVTYTSGSTGHPKGVEITCRALANVVEAMRSLLNIESGDRWLATTTIGFDISALEWLLPLSAGAAVILVPREQSTDGRLVRAEAEAGRATVIQGTPALWKMILAAGELPRSVRLALCGGEAMPSEIASQLACSPGREVWNLYGPTETTIWSLAYKLRPEPYQRQPPIGKPIANTHVYVVDENLRPVKAGTAGELLIGGDGVARGYAGNPGLSAEKFIPDISEGRSGLIYRTGDFVFVNVDGDLEFVGRKDHQVKIRGHRIELLEIEAALERFDEVESAVGAVSETAPGEKQLVGYLSLRAGAAITGLEARARLLRILPEYMVPAAFVMVPEMPLTSNGKVDRQALRRTDWPVAANDEAATATQRVLARIWSEVLSVPEVGIHSDFFELGGHSLSAMLIVMKISELLGVELSLLDIIDHPTIAELSVAIKAGAGAGVPALQA